MNLLESKKEAFFANFNQDCSSLSVGSKTEYRFYSLKKVGELGVIHGIVAADIRIIERLFSSAMFALVTFSAPRIVKICHVMQEDVVGSSYPSCIYAVKLNSSRLVVSLEESLYINTLPDMKVQHIIRYISPNLLGLCILSPSNHKNFVAYPGSGSKGEIHIFDAFNNCSKGMIPAHKNPLVAMAFDPTGTKIATASVRGTVIRVFDVIEKTKLYEFRRSVMRCVRIFSLCFSQDSNYLSSSSNTDSVHIFRLNNPREEASAEEPQGLVSYFNKVMSSPPSMVQEDRAFATVRLPFCWIRNICALAMIEDSLRVLIVSEKGILYIYNVDTVNGGECVLEHTHNLSETNERGSSGSSVPQNNPLRSVCVRGRTQHQEAPERTPE